MFPEGKGAGPPACFVKDPGTGPAGLLAWIHLLNFLFPTCAAQGTVVQHPFQRILREKDKTFPSRWSYFICIFVCLASMLSNNALVSNLQSCDSSDILMSCKMSMSLVDVRKGHQASLKSTVTHGHW